MRYDADGERWDVYLSDEEPRDGLGSLIFHCTSNSSHGWRVVEVPAGEYEAADAVERLEDDELGKLFERSQPFDYAHDPKAMEDHVGDSGIR